jgi:ankyrin repeat protein
MLIQRAFTAVLNLASYRNRAEDRPSNIEYLNILLLKGARLEHSGVLYGALKAKKNRIETLKFLLDRGANPNTDVPATHQIFSPPLHQAVARGDLEAVTLFLEYGADPYMQNRKGVTAFDKNKSASCSEIQAAMESAVLNKSHESRANS